MIVKALHPNIEGNPQSYLTEKANSGQSDIVVQNASEFSANDHIVIGNPGEEQTEIKKIDSISGKTITLSANLTHNHSQNTKIQYIKYDQVKFYKASSKTGSYTLQTTKDIAIDEPHTLYDDTSALATDYYKIKYYNSASSDLSTYSDAIGSGGFPRYALMSIVDRILTWFNDMDEKFLSRDEIKDWVNDVKDDMANEIAESNEKHFAGYELIPMVADQGNYDLNADFKKFQKVKASYNGTNYHRARRIDLEQIDDDNVTYSQNYPRYAFNKYQIEIRPKGVEGGYIKVWSEDHPADLDSDDDELPKPIRFYVNVLIDGVKEKALEKDRKFDDAAVYGRKYQNGKETMIEHINNLVLDENRGVRDDNDEFYVE